MYSELRSEWKLSSEKVGMTYSRCLSVVVDVHPSKMEIPVDGE